MAAVSDTIFEMVKNNLHITYTLDESGTARLTNETADGMQYIKRYCDPAALFEPGEKYAALLCEYVLRAEAGALETFAADYAAEIRAGKLEYDVDKYAEAMGYAE